MMRVAGDEKDVLDAGRRLDACPDRRGRLPRRSAPQVEADHGNAFAAGGQNQGPRMQRIEHANTRSIMTRSIAPHGETDGWRDLYFGSTRAELLTRHRSGL